ncbi:hypothetical protein BD309DRAFT_863645 [Dichomitus squalens]|nr:hypothetical protein BD309DRAFT_863645 [Dichomitus squalens]
MAKLRAFLSGVPDVPRTYTIRDIRHRYLLWKSHGVLRNLSPMDISSLICLLGTLSLSTSTVPYSTLYSHPGAPLMKCPTYNPPWELLATLFCDKRYSLRYPLVSSDRYWMMRTYLARFSERASSDPAEAERYLFKAGKLYASLSTAAHPDIHVPYLQALLASPSAASADALTKSFASLLTRRWCHPAIVNVLLQVVLRSQEGPLAASRWGIINALAEGIAARDDRDPPVYNAEPTSADTESSRVPPALGSGISRLAMALEGAAFGSGWTRGHSQIDNRLRSWSVTIARRVFAVDPDSEDTVDLRWNCLVFLALARTRSTDVIGQSAFRSQDPVQQAAVVEWQTICILTILENLLQSQSEPGALPLENEILRGLASVVRNVWRDWTTVHPSVAPPRSLLVTRLICASVFKLAGQLKDKALVDMCREYTVAAALWSMDLDKPRTEDGLQEMAAEQLYASLECGTFFERALVDLMLYASHVRTLRAAVDLSIVRYARTDPEHAQEFVAWSSNRNIVPTHTVVATVGVALARYGVGDYLDRYMNDVRLPPESRERVLFAHLCAYVRQGREFMAPRNVANVMDRAFLVHFQLDSPMRLTSVLRSTLFVLIRHGYARKVVTLVEGVSAQQPALSTAQFYTRLLHALLRHRQYSEARRLLVYAVLKYPDMTSRWTALVLFRLYRVGVRRLATRVASHIHIHQPPSFAMLADLARNLQSQPRQFPSDRSVTSSLASIGVDVDDPRAWQYTVNLLARAGRTHAAKQFFLAIHERASPPVRTSLGNTILHGYLLRTRSSNRRRLRLVTHAYKEFAEQHDFVADHVTVNILLKAQLRSRTEVNGAKARELFDALVQLGYPTGEAGGRSGSPPFGTKIAAGIRIGDLDLPRIDAPLSFKRHVEPMYKTFIKAFYQRGDVVAARKIIGMLKILEVQG